MDCTHHIRSLKPRDHYQNLQSLTIFDEDILQKIRKKCVIGRVRVSSDMNPQLSSDEGNHSMSLAFLKFKKRLDVVRECYSVLNPCNGELAAKDCILGPDDQDSLHPIVREFLSGGVLRVIVTFEAFIKDLMTETFDKVTQQLREEYLIQLNSEGRTRVKKRLETLVDSVRRTEGLKNFNSSWFLLRGGLFDEPSSLSDSDWEIKRDEYRKNHLASISPRLSSIDKTFKELFYPDDRLFLMLHKFKVSIFTAGETFKYSYRLAIGDGCNVTFIIRNPTLLRHIVNLYYGLRCELAHGSSEQTLHKGALSTFPADQDELNELISGNVYYTPTGEEPSEDNLDNKLAKELSSELYNIYVTLKDNGDEGINYLTLVNMYRFFRQLSFSLVYAIAYLVWRDFQVTLWNFDPRIFEKHNPVAWLQLNVRLHRPT